MFVLIVAFLFHCYFVVTIDIISSQREYKFRLEEEMCRLMMRILGYLIPARAIVGLPLSGWSTEMDISWLMKISLSEQTQRHS